MQGCPRTAACYGAAVKLAARYSRRGVNYAPFIGTEV